MNIFADEIGTLKLNQVPKQVISAGDVGYLISGIKEAKEVKVGDTLTMQTPTTNIIKGFECETNGFAESTSGHGRL
jgi:GTP-binding protein LepA